MNDRLIGLYIKHPFQESGTVTEDPFRMVEKKCYPVPKPTLTQKLAQWWSRLTRAESKRQTILPVSPQVDETCVKNPRGWTEQYFWITNENGRFSFAPSTPSPSERELLSQVLESVKSLTEQVNGLQAALTSTTAKTSKVLGRGGSKRKK